MSLVFTTKVGVEVTEKIVSITGSTETTSLIKVNTAESMAAPVERVKVVSKKQFVFESPVKVIVFGTEGVLI